MAWMSLDAACMLLPSSLPAPWSRRASEACAKYFSDWGTSCIWDCCISPESASKHPRIVLATTSKPCGRSSNAGALGISRSAGANDCTPALGNVMPKALTKRSCDASLDDPSHRYTDLNTPLRINPAMGGLGLCAHICPSSTVKV
eukprot:1416308-Pyramimonas_sp.AAC.1